MPETKLPLWFESKWAKWGRDIAIVALLFWGISAWQTRDMLDTDGSVQISSMAMASLDGEVQPVFNQQYSDKPTLVYFFAPWCSICKMSIANLNGLDTDNINIVRVALDYSSIEDVSQFIDATRAEGPILLGTNEIKRDFQVPGYPSYYLLDEENRVIGKSMGYSSEWGMKLKSYMANRS